jgi:hypothetical protein
MGLLLFIFYGSFSGIIINRPQFMRCVELIQLISRCTICGSVYTLRGVYTSLSKNDLLTLTEISKGSSRKFFLIFLLATRV